MLHVFLIIFCTRIRRLGKHAVVATSATKLVDLKQPHTKPRLWETRNLTVSRRKRQHSSRTSIVCFYRKWLCSRLLDLTSRRRRVPVRARICFE